MGLLLVAGSSFLHRCFPIVVEEGKGFLAKIAIVKLLSDIMLPAGVLRG